VMRCMLLCMLEAVEGRLWLLEVSDVSQVLQVLEVLELLTMISVCRCVS